LCRQFFCHHPTRRKYIYIWKMIFSLTNFKGDFRNHCPEKTMSATILFQRATFWFQIPDVIKKMCQPRCWKCTWAARPDLHPLNEFWTNWYIQKILYTKHSNRNVSYHNNGTIFQLRGTRKNNLCLREFWLCPSAHVCKTINGCWGNC
jgi:hypothetical protein